MNDFTISTINERIDQTNEFLVGIAPTRKYDSAVNNDSLVDYMKRSEGS